MRPSSVASSVAEQTVMLTLDVYSHVIPSLHEESAQTMERVLSGTAVN